MKGPSGVRRRDERLGLRDAAPDTTALRRLATARRGGCYPLKMRHSCAVMIGVVVVCEIARVRMVDR